MKLFWLAALLAVCTADIFLHFPRGSNNRMEDGGRDRDNWGRLFDSNNNNRGGNNRGSGQEYYYSGSTLPISWVSDLGCGAAEPNNLCTIILQYSCDRWMRDGYYDWEYFEDRDHRWRSTTIPFYKDDQEDCRPFHEKFLKLTHRYPDGNCSVDRRWGMHEPYSVWETCRRTSRNKGLYWGSIKIDNNDRSRNGAIYTRTNQYGWRFGLECPEERDYYPYWQPSQWRDALILTDTPERCDAYKAESFNVKSRWVCKMSEKFFKYMEDRSWWESGFVPITEAECLDPTIRNPAQQIIYDSKTGEAINVGEWVEVDPHNIPAPECYATPHTHVNKFGNTIDSGWPAMFNFTVPDVDYADPLARDSCVWRIRYNVSSVEQTNYGWESPTSVGPSDNSFMNSLLPYMPTYIPIWTKYQQTQPAKPYIEGQKTMTTYDVEHGYVYGDHPWVDIFGSFIAPKHVYLELAINTNETFSVSQDRSHTFSIRPLPAGLANHKIYNLGVQGKRGNIVQTFPGTEYDFFPMRLHVELGDLIHIQWNGANTNPRGNAGEGPAGFDRSNMLVQRGILYYEEGQELNTANNIGHWSQSYPEPFSETTGPRFLGLSYEDCVKLSLPPLYSGYFDLGVRQVGGTAPAVYHYLSTRNNNFTNRSQKGKVVVNTNSTEIRQVAAATWESLQTRDDIGWAHIRYSYDERRQGQFTVRLTDAGPSGGVTNWVLVEPRYISIPDGGYMVLKINHPWVPFTYGRIFWAEDMHSKPIEVFTKVDTWSWDGTGHADAMINLGGYYRVDNVVNGSAVGGVIIAFIGVVVVSYFIYKRFGCRIFNKTDMNASQKEGLLGPGAVSSSAAASSPSPATTGTGDKV